MVRNELRTLRGSLSARLRGGNQCLAVLAQLLSGFSKRTEAYILRLAMIKTEINLLQDHGKTPVTVNQVKGKV